VFAAANLVLPRDAPRYEMRIVATNEGVVPTFSGLRLGVDQTLAQLRDRPDTLVIAGRVDMSPSGVRVPVIDGVVTDWLAQHGPRAGRIAAVYGGTQVAAAAGLLNGHRATTHWGTADILAAEHPSIEVDSGRIFIQSGRVWTCAGITASMDLALALVGEDHGPATALNVARMMVMYPQRACGQGQFKTALALPRGRERRDLAELRRWIVTHLAEDLSVSVLARRMAVTPRHLSRIFQTEIGLSPAEFVLRMRMEYARRLLERTDLPPERIAEKCGLGSIATLHRVFRNRLGLTPGRYRLQFATDRV
jgi:transcriptional regulator GlxA family with amidase domain